MPTDITANHAGQQEERLTLRSRISDITQVPAWIEHLAARYGISPATQFAMNLCLEEIVSNIVRHGYGGDPDGSVAIRFTSLPPDRFLLVVEDQAPRFDPLAVPEPPLPSSLDDTPVGGQGIRLVRRFAEAVTYAPLPDGNRLTLAFSAI